VPIDRSLNGNVGKAAASNLMRVVRLCRQTASKEQHVIPPSKPGEPENRMKLGKEWLRSLVSVALALFGAGPILGQQQPDRGLAVDDVLDTIALDAVAPSPDDLRIAAVVQRPARAGEAYGQTAYEVDPSRADIWLVSRRSNERSALTQGGAQAAGFWCPSWSPDGRRLAMLSTMPEGGEPRGGDNVRLYVWDGKTSKLPRRVMSAAMMTQSRYGSPLNALDVRGGTGGGSLAQVCRSWDENAPYAWLDDHRLLAVTLPDGQISALLDQCGRFFDHAAATRFRLHAGDIATVSAAGTGAARMDPAAPEREAVLRIVDVRGGTDQIVARVPAYPFFGALTVSIAPDGRRAAILAPVGLIPLEPGGGIPYNDDTWQAERRLGFVDLATGGVRWATLRLQRAIRSNCLTGPRTARPWRCGSVPAAATGRPDCSSRTPPATVSWRSARRSRSAARRRVPIRTSWAPCGSTRGGCSPAVTMLQASRTAGGWCRPMRRSRGSMWKARSHPTACAAPPTAGWWGSPARGWSPLIPTRRG
jgi:hypothetical protein